MTKTTRSAIVSAFNILGQQSEWLALPVDDPLRGPRVVFVHRKACALFGKVGSSDFFTGRGDASRLAEAVYGIACAHGLVAKSAALTCCPVIVGIAPSVLTKYLE